MTAPQNECAFDPDAAVAAAERWGGRDAKHARFADAVRQKKYSELDTAVRRAKRANRLLAKLHEDAPQAAEDVAAQFVEADAREIAEASVSADTINDYLLERVMGETRDFQFIEFLEQAIHVSKSVGRIVTELDGRRLAFGTGFMVSPDLLMTNHHVLSSPDIAARSIIEFNYQRDRHGREVGVSSFQLDPARFFLNDKELDFALVAVSPGANCLLASFGWCPLIKEEGKIIVGEAINIVQHPNGERKQVIIRENRLIDLLELHAHYEADTEPGSSGSPVFNDQWEVVALHHSGVPKRNGAGQLLRTDGEIWQKGRDAPGSLDFVANEGIRVSRLVNFIQKAKLAGGQAHSLLKDLLEAKPSLMKDESIVPPEQSRLTMGSATLTVPLHITVSIDQASALLTATVQLQRS